MRELRQRQPDLPSPALGSRRAGAWLGWALVPGVWIALAAPSVAFASVCACKTTASGTCQRWHQADIPWSLYLGPGQATIGDDVFELAAKSAFAAWSDIQCGTCMVASPDASRCEPAACDAQPLGPKFVYLGRTSQPALGFSCAGVFCSAAAAGTAQVGVIRDPAQWPVSKSVVSALMLTSKAGKIIDADVILFDNGHSFCLNDCMDNQYALMGVLMQEVSHFLGIGYAENTLSSLAANFQTTALTVPKISEDDIQCACTIYRTSDDPAECAAPPLPPAAVEVGCGAAPAGPGQAAWPVWAGSMVAAGTALLWRRRQRRGSNSPAP